MSHKVVCFFMLDFETSNSKREVSKSNYFVENYFFLETTLLQRELFLTMFYTINLSPLLSFMMIIMLSITNSVHCL